MNQEITFTSKITVELVQSVGSDEMIAKAARVSTLGENTHAEKIDGLLEYLIKMKHAAPFEHGQMTFRVHAPIFVFREWHRHRTWSYSEESARYKELEPVFWIPSSERKMVPGPDHKSARPSFVGIEDEDLYEQVIDTIQASYGFSYEQYQRNLQRGISKEVARCVLPVGIYSSMYATVNSRNVMSFLSLRTHEPIATHVSYPQKEIEEAARQIEDIFSGLFPITYKHWISYGRGAL